MTTRSGGASPGRQGPGGSGAAANVVLAVWLAFGVVAGGCGGSGDEPNSAGGADVADAAGGDVGREDGGDSAGGTVTVDGAGADLSDSMASDGLGQDGQGSGDVATPDVGPDPDLPVAQDVADGETGASADATPDTGDSQGVGDIQEDADATKQDVVADDGQTAETQEDALTDGAPTADGDTFDDTADDTGPELPPQPQVICGDGTCDPSEDACGCPGDCGCGDGTCDHTETWLSCAADCGGCGDGHCGPDEDQAGCPDDCGTCGDGVCDLAEDAATCPADCGACPAADYVCADSGCYPWYEPVPGTDIDPHYDMSCGEPGASWTMDLTLLGDAKRLLASVNGPGFAQYDTALAVYTDFSTMCASAGGVGGATPDACVDTPAGAQKSELLLSDLPRARLRFVGYSQPGSDVQHTLLAQTFYGPGEPCMPGPSQRGCYVGECVAACNGDATGRCPDFKDCADGIDSDGDGLTDEDPCADPPVVSCPTLRDGQLGDTVVLGVSATGNLAKQIAPSVPWVDLISAPPSSSGQVLGDSPSFSARLKPDVDGLYVVRSTFSSVDGEVVACDTTVNVGAYDCKDGIDNDGDGFTDEQGAGCVGWAGVLCPDDALVLGLGDVVLGAAGYGALEGQPLTWSAVAAPDGAAPQVTSGADGAGTFTPDQAGRYTLRAEGVVPGTVSHFACETRVMVGLYDCADGIDADRDGQTDEDAAQCDGAQAVTCSADTTVPVLSTAGMDTHTSAAVGSAPGDLGALWSVEAGPPTWYAAPTTPGGASQTCDATGCTQPAELELLMAGTYRGRYMTVDAAGHLVGCEQELTTSIPDGLRIELTWNPDVPVPLDTSDVDLHLRAPTGAAWFDDADELDCYYSTCISDTPTGYPDWGMDGDPANNPRLDVDDTEGHGPENINILAPDLGVTYRLGVHLFDADHTPLSTSTVRIFCGGQLTAELGPLTLPQPNPTAGGEDLMFWEVATITFDASGSCAVTELGDLLTNIEAGY